MRLLLLRLLLYAIVGGKYCPTVLSSNKELVLGVLVGLALCSFAGLRLEGLMVPACDKILDHQGTNAATITPNRWIPASCKGYRRGGGQVDTTRDSDWCNDQINPGNFCIDKLQLDEMPMSCCDQADTEECRRFDAGRGDNNWTFQDILNRCGAGRQFN